MNQTPLYIVGMCCEAPGAWEFVGVFDSVAGAEAACTDARYFVGSATLNERVPDDSLEWPGAYSPIAA